MLSTRADDGGWNWPWILRHRTPIACHSFAFEDSLTVSDSRLSDLIMIIPRKLRDGSDRIKLLKQ